MLYIKAFERCACLTISTPRAPYPPHHPLAAFQTTYLLGQSMSTAESSSPLPSAPSSLTSKNLLTKYITTKKPSPSNDSDTRPLCAMDSASTLATPPKKQARLTALLKRAFTPTPEHTTAAPAPAAGGKDFERAFGELQASQGLVAGRGRSPVPET
jgi:hypothetical protein